MLISGTWATVELHAEATAKGGWAFDNQYCWLLEFRHGLVQVLPVSVHQLKSACVAADMQDVLPLMQFSKPLATFTWLQMALPCPPCSADRALVHS